MLSSFPCKAAYSIISANHCNKISISPHKNHTQHGFSKGHFRFSKSAANSQSRWFRLVTLCQREQPPVPAESKFSVEVGQPIVPAHMQAPRLSLEDQAFFLLAFIACTTSIAFTSLVIAAVPTLYAMGRAATSVSKLADTAREELPSTMAAIRLSGIEISDLTLELSDLSQEIADGVSKSAQAVQAAEAGIRQIGSVARHQTMSAAKKTSHAVGQARKSLMNIISRGEVSLEDERNESENMDI